MLLLSYGFLMSYGDYIPFVPRGKQVNFDSGIAGTLRGALIDHVGGKRTGMVSIEKSLVPEKVIKERRVGGINYFIDLLTMGNVTIYVTGEHWQWQDIPSNQCDNRHSAIRFGGNIKGEVIPYSPDSQLQLQLKNLVTANRYALTTMQWLQHQVANISSQKLMEMDSASQLLKEIGDRVKNVKILSKRGSEDAVASELGS